MDITSVTAHQIILLRFDEIPLTRLVHKKSLAELGSLFQFANIQVDEKLKIVCQIGVHQDGDQEYAVKNLVIEERRVLIDVDGPTSVAEGVFEKLRDFLREYISASNRRFLIPIITANETEIVTKLDFQYSKLFNPGFLQFVNDATARYLSLNDIIAKPTPSLLNFAINYPNKDESLDDYQIAISRKDFIFGPRPGFPLSDQVYYSKAPTDTDFHIQILLKLEELFK